MEQKYEGSGFLSHMRINLYIESKNLSTALHIIHIIYMIYYIRAHRGLKVKTGLVVDDGYDYEVKVTNSFSFCKWNI